MKINIFFKKIVNTYLRINLPFIDYSKVYNKKNLIFTLLSKFIWFIPSNTQALYWKNSESIGHGHNHFIKMDEMSLLLKKEICNYASKQDKILDVCCNVGRMLNSLSEDGYYDLNGFDINKDAIDQSKKVFHRLKDANLTCLSAEEYLSTRKNNEFDITFTLSATIELIPSSYPVIKEISRITKKYFICIINEDGHAYPRFWKYEFKKNNFTILKSYKVENEYTMFVLIKNNFHKYN